MGLQRVGHDWATELTDWTEGSIGWSSPAGAVPAVTCFDSVRNGVLNKKVIVQVVNAETTAITNPLYSILLFLLFISGFIHLAILRFELGKCIKARKRNKRYQYWEEGIRLYLQKTCCIYRKSKGTDF